MKLLVQRLTLLAAALYGKNVTGFNPIFALTGEK